MGWVLLLQLHEDMQVLTKTVVDISHSLKLLHVSNNNSLSAISFICFFLLQGGSVSWDHLIYEAILVVMVIAGYHAYYRSQWEAHVTTMMSKMMQEIERSSHQHSNHVFKTRDHHDDTAEQPYTRDTVVSSYPVCYVCNTEYQRYRRACV